MAQDAGSDTAEVNFGNGVVNTVWMACTALGSGVGDDGLDGVYCFRLER